MSGGIDTAALRAANPPEAVAARLGLEVVRRGPRLAGPCPSCGKRRKFDIHATSGAFNCFVCDLSGGDVIALTMALRGKGFVDACRWLGGGAELPEADRARLAAEAREREAEDRRRAEMRRRADLAEMATIVKQCRPASGTPVQDYLENRGLRAGLAHLDWLDGAWPDDVKYHPALPAWAGEAGRRERVGDLPAMVAIGRDRRGRPVLLHRTFLQKRDGVWRKAAPEGADGEPLPGWAAKQVLGSARACDAGVALGASAGITDDPSAPDVVAEGIETALAVAAGLAAVGQGLSLSAALSLGRLTGKRTVADDGVDTEGFVFAATGRPKLLACDDDLAPTLAFPDIPDTEPAPDPADPLSRRGGYRRARAEFTRAGERLRAAARRAGDRGGVALIWPGLGLDFNDRLQGRRPLAPYTQTSTRTETPA